MKPLLAFIGLLVTLGLFMFFLFVIKAHVENVLEGIDTIYYEDNQKEYNTNVSCDIFCKNFSSIPENCPLYNNDKIVKCLDKNNSPIQPQCNYDSEIKKCQNVV